MCWIFHLSCCLVCQVSSFPEVASEQQTDTNSSQNLDIDTSDIESPAHSPWHPMKKQQEKQTEKTVNTCAKYTDLLPINYFSNIESVISIILLLSIKLSPPSKVPKNRTNQKTDHFGRQRLNGKYLSLLILLHCPQYIVLDSDV